MECQNIIKNLRINKNKRIGEIVIVVEGESKEFKLLKHIFTTILDYNCITIRRNKVMQEKFVSKNANDSTVIIANTSNSSIKSILEDKEYKEQLYKLLKSEYNKSLKNIPIYILWDRDNRSNDKNIVLENIKVFKSALDNDYDMNGLLLISYPCIESYELSNFKKRLWQCKLTSSEETKKRMKAIIPNLHNINEKSLLLATENMHKTMFNMGVYKYEPADFETTNLKIFSNEEDSYLNNGYYIALSLISVMFIDLGIISEID